MDGLAFNATLAVVVVAVTAVGAADVVVVVVVRRVVVVVVMLSMSALLLCLLHAWGTALVGIAGRDRSPGVSYRVMVGLPGQMGRRSDMVISSYAVTAMQDARGAAPEWLWSCRGSGLIHARALLVHRSFTARLPDADSIAVFSP